MEGIFQSLEWWPHWIDACPDRWDKYLAVATSGCRSRAHLTKEEFLKWFPMFADAPAEWIEMLIAQADFNPSVWGRWLKWGEALFVAHYLALRELLFAPWEEESEDGDSWLAGVVASSSISSFRAGAVAYTKDASAESKLLEDPMLKTSFGQQLLDLIRSRIAVGLVTVT
jgi:hypothetical protein